MTDILNHAVTLGDILAVAVVGITLLGVLLIFIVVAVNMGWLR